jgi:hypothetical protein
MVNFCGHNRKSIDRNNVLFCLVQISLITVFFTTTGSQVNSCSLQMPVFFMWPTKNKCMWQINEVTCRTSTLLNSDIGTIYKVSSKCSSNSPIITLFQNLQFSHTYALPNNFLQQQYPTPITFFTSGSTIQKMFDESLSVHLSNS